MFSLLARAPSSTNQVATALGVKSPGELRHVVHLGQVGALRVSVNQGLYLAQERCDFMGNKASIGQEPVWMTSESAAFPGTQGEGLRALDALVPW